MPSSFKQEHLNPVPDLELPTPPETPLDVEGQLHVEKCVGRASDDADVFIVDFASGTSESPRKWPKWKKWYVTSTVSFLCLAVALGSSIVTGDIEGPTVDLDTQQEIVNLTITCFVIGFGIGPLLFAPLSEVLGRTLLYQISMFLYFIFTLPSALAKNSATLVVARQIAGLAASAPMCNVGGSVADIWSTEDRGPAMAIFSGTIFLGPTLGPVVGGWIGGRAGWRWIYWVLFIFSGVSFALTLFIPETLSAVLLKKKAQKLRKQTGDGRYRTKEEVEEQSIGRKSLKEKTIETLGRPLVMLALEPIVILFSFYLAFVYSLLYLLFFAFPIAFAEVRGFSLGITGTTFVSIMIGIGIAMCLLPVQERVYKAATVNGTFPEARLYGMMVGSIALPIALFIFAFTGGYAHVNFMGPCVAGAIFGFAMIVIYVSANSYIVDSYSSYAASAIAAKTLLRSLVGAAVPLYVNQMFHNMGFQWAGLLLALVAMAIAPIPFVFYKYGEKIRARSSRAEQNVRVE